MGAIFGFILNLLGSSAVGKALDYLEKRANTETERLRISALKEQALAQTQASVITAGMAHKVFWVPWAIATCPLTLWFGWGMLDTTFPGYLPHVAKIPDGLLPWAQMAWQNLFYSGGGVVAATVIGNALTQRR